jgi:hypothetical protein
MLSHCAPTEYILQNTELSKRGNKTILDLFIENRFTIEWRRISVSTFIRLRGKALRNPTNGCQGIFALGKSGRGVKLTTYPQPASS